MNATMSRESMDGIADVVGHVRQKGISIWTENGQLHYKALKGALSQEEIRRLKESRIQIIAFLEGVTGLEIVKPQPACRPSLNRAPLSFSQLAHWQMYQLQERSTVRHVT